MNTPAHLIFGLAAFSKPDARAVNIMACLGAVAPDLSLYFMVFWNRFVRGMSFDEIFGEQYFNSYWQAVFAIDNSIPLWVLMLAVFCFFRWSAAIAFAGAGLLHVVLDFPLHHDDGRSHFWPFTDWIYESPVSYWDPHHFGGVVGPIEGVISLILLVILWRRFPSVAARVGIVALGLMECVPALLFPILFSFD